MLTINRMLVISVAAACLLGAGTVLAKSSKELEALQQQVEALHEGQQKMQKDLDEIKQLLQRGGSRPTPSRQAFEPTDVELGAASLRGNSDAPVTLIEYSDYHCPYCKRHADTVMPTLIKQYVDSGKLRFVMREYPIDRLHPRATAASEAALCAGDQGQYWGMHDALFADQKATSDESFQQMAAALGLDVAAFKTCMETDKFLEQIRAQFAEGQRMGVIGTPSFVVGLTDGEDPNTVHLSKFIRGAQPLGAFSAAIDELLKTANAEK